MTKVEQIIIEEKEEAVKEAVKETEDRKDEEAKQEKIDIALSLLKAGDTIEKVAQCVGIPLVTVQGLVSKI